MGADRQSTDTVVTEASAWIARLETGELSVSDMAAFREWVRRSPRHAAEVNRLAAVATDLEQLSARVSQNTAVDIDVLPVEYGRGKGRWSKLAVGMAGVAAAVLVAVSVVVVVDPLKPGPDHTNGFFATPVGGYLEMALVDGSLVRLNTDTRLTVAYDHRRRIIELHRGEAYVRVADDAAWPFEVRTDRRVVQAVGTAFVVRLEDERLRVMVTEGSVAISQRKGEPSDPPATPGKPLATAVPGASMLAAPILLESGQSYEDSPGGVRPVAQVAEAEVRRRLAWQRGLVEFTDTPLHEVVEEISRYTNLTIRFDDAELRDVRFGGIFPTGEIHLLFGVLESTYGVSVVHVDGSNVTLTSQRP